MKTSSKTQVFIGNDNRERGFIFQVNVLVRDITSDSSEMPNALRKFIASQVARKQLESCHQVIIDQWYPIFSRYYFISCRRGEMYLLLVPGYLLGDNVNFLSAVDAKKTDMIRALYARAVIDSFETSNVISIILYHPFHQHYRDESDCK